ncbi:MAG: sigma-E factor negative regulatory protein [Gammaproteobacteria bacterium]
MNDEDISALADDEIEAARLADLLQRIGEEGNARRTWARYHLIGEVLRGEDGGAERPRETVPRTVVAPMGRAGRLRVPLAGLAIAASVAALTVVLVAGNRDIARGTSTGVDVAEDVRLPPLATTPVESVMGEDASGLVPASAHDQRLNGYLVNFNEQRARLGMPGVHPYVRIVGFEQR